MMFRFKNVLILLFIMLLGNWNIFAQEPIVPEVSDEDLTLFASAFTEVQNINNAIQQKMVSVVEGEGIEVERFNEIQQAQQDPNLKVEVTEEEKAQFVKATQKVQELQVQAQQKMRTKIEEEGLTIDDYQKIITAVQNSPELQQKLQKILEEG